MRFFFSCILIFLTFRASFGAEIGAASSLNGDFTLEAETCSFRDEQGAYEELAIRFSAIHLAFRRQDDSLYIGRYRPLLEIYDQVGKLVKKIEGERQFVSARAIRDTDRFVTDITQFRLPPGHYRAELTVRIPGSDRVGRQILAIEAPHYAVGYLALSGIRFVHEINARELKAGQIGRQVKPLVVSIFSPGKLLTWYAELYEIGRLVHTLRFSIRDRFGHILIEEERQYPPYRSQAQFVEAVSLRGLPSGRYSLHVEARAGGQTAQAKRAFQIAGPQVEPSTAFTRQRQDAMNSLLRHFAAPEAADQYGALTAPERAVFAYGYFLDRSPEFAQTYVGPITGLGNHVVSLSMLRALGFASTIQKRVDRTFGDRLPEPDTLAVRRARNLVDYVCEKNPSDPYAQTAKALLALEIGNLAEGERDAQRALMSMPEFSEAHNAMGIARMGQRDWDGALRQFQLAKAPHWHAPQVNANLVRFLSGRGGGESALDNLSNAVAHDPTHPWLHYLKGRLLERRGALAKSAEAYARQIAVNPALARARFDLGRVLFKQGHIDSAVVIWRMLMDARPDFRRLCVHPLLEAYLNIGETGKAQMLIAEELRTLGDEARARVEDISLVAGPDEMSAYRRLAPEDRSQFVRAFWQKRDPTPATPGNERLVEHYRRVVYALQHFSKDGQTWDRRGDVYIRYGEPAHISRSSDIRFETDPAVVRVKERLLASLSPEARQEIIARAGRLRTSTRDVEIEGEAAERVNVSDFESIDFEMNPNRVFFAAGTDDTYDYVRGKELFGRDRMGMSEYSLRGIPLYPVDGSTPWEYWIYPDVAGGIEVVFTALGPRGTFDFPDVSQGRKLARFNEHLWEKTRSETVIARAVHAQPDRYSRPGTALDFYYATAGFRGEGDRSRLELYYGVPLFNISRESQQEYAFERGIALFDTTWTPIYRRLSPMQVRMDADSLEAGTLAVDELAFQVPAGRYYLGVQVNHLPSRRCGGYTQEIEVEDYTSPGLKISDIELAGTVEADSSTATKGGLRVIPLPSRTYKQGQPIVLYYEIYGLADDAFGRTRYRVDYRIVAREGKLRGVKVLRALGRLVDIREKAAVTISYEHTGSQNDEYNYIEIDPGNSKPGRYQVTVTVVDLNAEQADKKSIILMIE